MGTVPTTAGLAMFPCPVQVNEGEIGVAQTCGKYSGKMDPGCHLACWPITDVNSISVRVEQLDVSTDTKTHDNVSVKVVTAIQYMVDKAKVYDAYFLLDNPRQQMSAYVDDVVRSELPTMTLDAAYEAKTEMADSVLKVMSAAMSQFGFLITKVLITDLQPDQRVQSAMNDINTQKRQRAAAEERAEGEKLLKVKAAEADMESKYLSGVGIAKMRKAITGGFQESITVMKDNCGLDAADVVHMMLVTQYMDTLKDFATTGKSSIVLSHNPAAMADIESQVKTGFTNAKSNLGM